MAAVGQGSLGPNTNTDRHRNTEANTNTDRYGNTEANTDLNANTMQILTNMTAGLFRQNGII